MRARESIGPYENTVFRVARAMVDLGEEMWVSPEQFQEFSRSKKFTADELKLLIAIENFPYPDDDGV